MQTLRRSVNPFEMMMDPEFAMRAIAQAERLVGVNRRICRPLDKPAPTKDAAKDTPITSTPDDYRMQ